MTALDAFSLAGRVAIVTGASSGLGTQICDGLCQGGAKVVLFARRQDALSKAAAESGCDFEVGDVTSAKDRAVLVERTIERHGKIDILVNNAGIASTRPAEEETADGFRKVLET